MKKGCYLLVTTIINVSMSFIEIGFNSSVGFSMSNRRGQILFIIALFRGEKAFRTGMRICLHLLKFLCGVRIILCTSHARLDDFLKPTPIIKIIQNIMGIDYLTTIDGSF